MKNRNGRFTKTNQPEGRGRPKGKTVKQLAKVDEVLANAGINITQRILDLIPELEPKMKLEAYALLLKYSQPSFGNAQLVVVQNGPDTSIKEASSSDLLSEVIDVQPSE